MEVAFNVPDSLSEIKLSDYQKYASIIDGNTDEHFIKQKMVQIFCDVPLLAVNRMRRKDFNDICNVLVDTLSQRPGLTKVFELDRKKFGFIPNLDNMSIGEFADLDKYMTENKTLDRAMAVLFRPTTYIRKDKYRIEDYEGSSKYQRVLADMPMDVVMGALVFFWTLSTQLLAITPKYLERKVQTKKGIRRDLEKNGVGFSTSINLLRETCSKLEKLLKYQSGKPLPS